MANYKVQITNGAGSAKMQTGEYDVTAVANGYDATSLSPATYNATQGGSGAFTLSAEGTLTLIFNETGAEGGTAVTAGSVVMTDSTGATTYGSPVSINGQGTAVFNDVPFSSEQPYTLYFSQTVSHFSVEPSSTTTTSKSLKVWLQRLSSSSSTSCGRL